MRRIDAHHQRSIPQARKLQPRGSGQAGLSNASLSAEQKDAHTSFYGGGGLFRLFDGSALKPNVFRGGQQAAVVGPDILLKDLAAIDLDRRKSPQ
jgi:hypothetical protein